ncbi:hypothetical protein BGP77_07640 [Saccharospirillum sp. MSK14-1]|uniref:sulfite exporter TauE/SafE family protein n=1 Tax=Saccharospirillum sp. MSK14-1 TaxID=1897632 RepID=UPI000D352E91|nr:sulfite exporter TauE/SafE family protein [Saccharospirillum sp. MSK14-1]PTY37133.1 hypothetical protein BGP77_07640 [Saccharospirillum sp. MSK14-1]
MTADLISAALIGLISAGHCLGMCGGITVALGLHSQGQGTLLFYNLGRIATYALLGLLIGAGLHWLPPSVTPVLRLIAALLLVLIALYYLNIKPWITQLEKLALPLWRGLQPLARRWLPLRHPLQAFPVGMIWGLLPCGLVYTALGYAATQANAIGSAALMLAFGLGTLPAMLATGAFSQQLNGWLRRPVTRTVIGAVLLCFAGWLIFNATHMLGGM